MQPKLKVSSSPKHTLWKLEKTNLKMDAPEFEFSALNVELAIDWHANPLSHHGLVKNSSLQQNSLLSVHSEPWKRERFSSKKLK